MYRDLCGVGAPGKAGAAVIAMRFAGFGARESACVAWRSLLPVFVFASMKVVALRLAALSAFLLFLAIKFNEEASDTR